jgi:glutamine amidotransferase
MICIINYGSGNLRSIYNGFRKIGQNPIVSDDISKIKEADALVLPGVGAFGSAMDNLDIYKSTILDHVDDGKPFLGICLGLQVLLSESEECLDTRGLDIFSGNVLRFPVGRKIPHMGWNRLDINKDCPILNGIKDDYFYFVHSYYANPEDKDIIVATTDYGFDVPAVLNRDNVFATQFHPEKSGDVGLKILSNFVDLLD